MERTRMEFDFAAYAVPQWVRTTVEVGDEVCVRGPIPATRERHRVPTANVVRVDVAPRLDAPAVVIAGLSALYGVAAALTSYLTGKLLTAAVIGVVALVVAGTAALVAGRARVLIRTERDGEMWFDVAAAEIDAAQQFAQALTRVSGAARRRRPSQIGV
jgi:hypothetical protein